MGADLGPAALAAGLWLRLLLQPFPGFDEQLARSGEHTVRLYPLCLRLLDSAVTLDILRALFVFVFVVLQMVVHVVLSLIRWLSCY